MKPEYLVCAIRRRRPNPRPRNTPWKVQWILCLDLIASLELLSEVYTLTVISLVLAHNTPFMPISRHSSAKCETFSVFCCAFLLRKRISWLEYS